MTFRARPKTTTQKQTNRQGQTKDVPVKLGYMPIGGDELFGIMDLTCLLPPRSNGVAVWQSNLAGEDFTIKLPNYLARFITAGEVLNEDLGEALARWQMGDLSGVRPPSNGGKRSTEQLVDDYVAKVGTFKTLDALREFQAAEGTAKFVAGVKERSQALHDRIVTANTRAAMELQPQADLLEESNDVQDD
jgi:hypothetical protein